MIYSCDFDYFSMFLLFLLVPLADVAKPGSDNKVLAIFATCSYTCIKLPKIENFFVFCYAIAAIALVEVPVYRAR
jgi:hypothetical protein